MTPSDLGEWWRSQIKILDDKRNISAERAIALFRKLKQEEMDRHNHNMDINDEALQFNTDAATEQYRRDLDALTAEYHKRSHQYQP